MNLRSKLLMALVVMACLVPTFAFGQFRLLGFDIGIMHLSHDGSTIVGNHLDSDGAVDGAFRWTKSTGLVVTNDVDTSYAVSADGESVLSWGVGPGPDDGYANLWTEADGFSWIDSPRFFPWAMSGDASMWAGVLLDSKNNHLGPVRVDLGSPVNLSGNGETYPGPASDDGSVLAGFDRTNIKALYWNADGGQVILPITPPNADFGSNLAITADGKTIAGCEIQGRGYVYTVATKKVTYFAAPNKGAVICVSGITDTGKVVGWYETTTAAGGFIWTPGQTTAVDLNTYLINQGQTPGKNPCLPWGISGDGSVIAGVQIDSNDDEQVFITGTGGILDELTVTGSSVEEDVAQVQGGDKATGTVTLTEAQTTNTVITLASSDTQAATVPSSITIPAGKTSGTFSIETYVVTDDTAVTLTAGFGTQIISGGFVVLEPSLESLDLDPINVIGGGSATGTIELNAKQPTDLVVELRSTDSSATVPASVLIPAGKTSVDFDIKTTAVATNTLSTISATAQGKLVKENLTVLAAQIATFTIEPASVLNGETATGVVTLTGATPKGGQTLFLTSNSAAVYVPPSLQIPEGESGLSFRIGTLKVAAKVTATVTATYLKVPRTATLTVNPGVYPYFTPVLLSGAYGGNALQALGYKGQNMKIGIYSPTQRYATDTTLFAKLFGISGFTVKDLLVDGGPDAASLADGYIEAALDIETIIGQAPNATVVVAEPPNTDQAEIDAFIELGAQGVSVISSSWSRAEVPLVQEGSTGVQLAKDFDAEANALAASGITIFEASGDSGAYSETVKGQVTTNMEASSTGVTSVGGTKLVTDATGKYLSETAWTYDAATNSGGSGGLSHIFEIPKWQTGPGVKNKYSNGARQVPDVAANADPASGYVVIGNGQLVPVGGTSASTPLWAGNVLLIEQAFQQTVSPTFKLGLLNPALYALGTEFENPATELPGEFYVYHDILTGNDGLYSAGPGWDFCAGWGSANFSKLLADLEGYFGKGTLLPEYVPIAPSADGFRYPVTIHTSTTSLTEPAQFLHTEKLYFAIAVQNQGKADAPSAATVLEIDGKIVAQSSVLGALAPGFFFTEDDFYTATLTAGTHTVTLIADYGNKVPEKTVSTSTYTRTIVVK